MLPTTLNRTIAILELLLAHAPSIDSARGCPGMGTLYVVQCFHEVDGDVIADKPILHGMEQLARNRAELLAEERDGVLVYAQAADADRDEYSEPVILAKYGHVPHPEQQSLRQAG